VWTRGVPYLLLAILDLVFFAELVLHPAQLLYSDHSDLLAMHLPTKQFLIESWRETDELPLWCPYSFGGTPLIHDVQVAVFYPLHYPLYWLHEDQVGPALAWLVVLHVLIAGWGMYAYARFRGLGGPGSFVAALGYMFAGKWLMHVLGLGHYIFTPLAWLPLVLLLLEQALRRRSFPWAAGAGAIFALIVVGTHPQLTLYTGVFIALWTLLAGRQGDKDTPSVTLSSLGWWLALGVCAALVAAALSAVQLLPALEAASQASRGVGVSSDELLRGTLPTLKSFLAPPLIGIHAEPRAGLGVLWTAVVLMAPLLCWKRVRFPFLVWVLLIGFALGGAVLLQALPGFRLFAFPQRMLIPAALPAALLAGTTVQTLIGNPDPGSNKRSLCWQFLLLLVLAAAWLSAAPAWDQWQQWRRGEGVPFPLYWAALPLTTLTALWLLVRRPSGRPLLRGTVWIIVLLADLWTLTRPLVAVRREADVYTPSNSVHYLAEHRTYRIGDKTYQGRVLSFGRREQAAMTPLGAALPLRLQLEAVLGYNSFDVHRYKEYLQFIADADGPVRPRQVPFGYPIVGEFPLKNQTLVDLLGVYHLQQPSDHFTIWGAEVFAAAPGGLLPLLGALQAKREDPELRGWRPVQHDPHPSAYVHFPGGIQDLGPFTLFRNERVLPRAFVVPHAEPLPQYSRVLDTLKKTDFTRTVLLEDFTPEAAAMKKGIYQPATIRNYQPNRVEIELDGTASGYLVLADVWFPGWTCEVDGRPVPVHRANYLFRAVPVAAGDRHVVFTFAPTSYRWGRLISMTSLAGVGVLLLLAGVRRRRRPAA
jgi:hypothetical protein